MTEAPIPNPEQLAKEYTGQQVESVLARFWAMMGDSALLWASGGCPTNPCGFPCYADGYLRSYRTYRWMLNHPVVRLVRSGANAPIEASYWQYKAADKSVPTARVEFIETMFDKLRAQSISDIVRGRDMGWAPFEPIWDSAGGETRLIELKPLLPDRTVIMTSKSGKFTGLEQSSGEPIDLKADSQGIQTTGLPAPYKAWIYTYDKECGNLYGRSWLENIRETAWKDWLDCAQQLQKIGAKLAGTQGILKTPADQGVAGDGKPKYRTDAIAAFKALSNGAPGMWLPSLAMNIEPQGQADLWKLLIDLSKTSLISLEVLDFGSTVEAIANLLDRQKHAEELMFAGGLRSSRTGLEGQHGTKAEAGVHTDTGMLVAELDDDGIASQVQPLVDAVLELNFGPSAIGSVTIDPPPLVDSKSERFSGFLNSTTVGNSDAQNAILEMTDVADVLEGLDIPVKEGAKWDYAAYLQNAAKMKADATQTIPAPIDGKPVNGNGNGLDPRVAAMSKRLGRRLGRN